MKTRLLYIDAARCCACLLVVASHVFAPVCAGMSQYSHGTWWFFNVFDSVIRPSAAIYVMISGVLFLGSTRKQSYLAFVWKRYSKLVPPFLVWSFIYAYYSNIGQDEPLRLGQVVRQILEEPTAYHLWFMYMILGLYLAMPVLKRFVRNAEPGDLGALLAVWMGFLTLRFFAPDYVGESLPVTVFSYGGYAVLGYAIAKTDYFQKSTMAWALLWLGIVAFNAVGTYHLTVANHGIMDEKFYFGASPLVAIQAAAMFVLLKKFDQNSLVFRTSWLAGAVKRFSRHSYNIYLNHALLISLLTNGVLGFTLSEKTGGNAYIGVGLTTSLVLAASLGLSLIAEKVPVLSNLLILSPAPEYKEEPRPAPLVTEVV